MHHGKEDGVGREGIGRGDVEGAKYRCADSAPVTQVFFLTVTVVKLAGPDFNSLLCSK